MFFYFIGLFLKAELESFEIPALNCSKFANGKVTFPVYVDKSYILTSEKLKRYRIFLTGNIHRFGFRHLVANYAKQNDIKGFSQYVGLSVLIEAEGFPGQIEPFITWCKKGPEGCIIQSFQMIEIPPRYSDSFEILPVEVINIEKMLTKDEITPVAAENKEINLQV